MANESVDVGALLSFLLTAETAAQGTADAAAWAAGHAGRTAGFLRPIERAVVGGFRADRLGFAFAAGYAEALRALLPGLPGPGDGVWALCATEEGGAHPRAIRARLEAAGDGFVLSGRKEFVTFGGLAAGLLVVASEGTDEAGRSRLVVVKVPAARDGVVVQGLPELGFVPEIPHASVELRGVRVEAGERLDGDGYEQYLKPFRTVEDCHVMAAFLGWLVRLGRRAAWPQAVIEELLVLVVAGCGLSAAPASAAAVHVALGGWLGRIAAWVEGSAGLWEAVDAETRGRWERDRALLRVAGKVRAQRKAAAWQRVLGT